MELTVLGSSSAGNCYILQNEHEALIIECGVNFKEVTKALNFNLKKVAGCLISHEHGDHSKYINDFLNSAITVWTSSGTNKALIPKIKGFRLPLLLEAGIMTRIGNFKIIPFHMKHDCAEPYGFYINHPEMGNTLFATDTYYLPNKFAGLNHILIECNYRMDILMKNVEAGRIPALLLKRTQESHFEYENCKNALLANDLSGVRNIVLIHLSDSNSHAIDFKQGIENATGKPVHIAEKGLKLNFNKTPF
ncbi:MAG: MBL fold metallo-hydrolase [Porphyromonadaceae bacterium]|jgi:phosphoribosyl 1,2-cyclic phosphodiesterase|nr:MBL fold metallo-hydrolase [Porphyromonadaceae bacterium]